MRVLVMGAGALGGYFGARLAEAGHSITYVARGAHLEAMQAHGLRVESPLGDLHHKPVRAVATPDDAEVADLVLFMVKSYDSEDAAKSLVPLMTPSTRLMTAQNGVLSQEKVAAIVGKERVLAGAVYMPADIKSPGVIRHSSSFHRLEIGSLEASDDAGLLEISTALSQAGFDVDVIEDAQKMLWEKFIVMATTSSMCCLTRLDIGPIRSTPETRDLMRQSMEETAAVARASDVAIAEDAVEKAYRLLCDVAPPNMHASMLDDLNRGRRLELAYLSGDIVRRGRALGVDTPLHSVAYGVLKPFIEGPPA